MNLALQVFSKFTSEARRACSDELRPPNADTTANFIGIILQWWPVANVKTPSKGRRLRGTLQEPVASLEGPQVQFLNSFMDCWMHGESESWTVGG